MKAVGRTFRRRPSDLLPFYLLEAAVPAMVQVGSVLGLALAYAYLEATGRMETIRSMLQEEDVSPPPEDEEDPEAILAWYDGVAEVVELAFPPMVLAILGATFLLAVMASLVLFALVSAGQLGSCHARLRRERGLTGGIAAIRQHWLPFVGLFVLEAVVQLVVFLAGASLVLAAGLITPLLGLLALLVVLPLWTAIFLLVRAVMAFAPVAIVVDDVGVIGSITATFGFLRRDPLAAVVYYAFAVVLVGGLAIGVGAFSLVGADRFIALLGLLAIYPLLDLFKTALYGGSRDSVSMPPPTEVRLRTQFVGGLRRGWSEMVGFVRGNPGLHALAVGTLMFGFVIGWFGAGPYVGTIETSIATRIEGLIPPAAALMFFGHNWTVAISMAYAGVAFAVPSLVALWYNGLAFGAVFRLEVELPQLLAFVAPHGLFEIPALFVAGALGIYLGIVVWRSWRGRIGRERLADELEQAFWVLVGVGMLLAVAGFIEGFISPYYWRPFL